MSRKTTRIDQVIGTLWNSMERSQKALEEMLGEVDTTVVSPALFTMFATSVDGLLKLSEAEGESLWYSFAEVADTLLKQGQITREECAKMSCVMDDTSEAITRSCERELVEEEDRNPIVAVLNGCADILGLDHDMMRQAVGPILAEFISHADDIPLDGEQA